MNFQEGWEKMPQREYESSLCICHARRAGTVANQSNESVFELTRMSNYAKGDYGTNVSVEKR